MKLDFNTLPTSPGCYIMKNQDNEVIYVGKAKNIKNRVKSYFSKGLNAKTQSLMSNVVDIDFIMTNSEQESLILEFNLIKKYMPKYNIRLIDDKSYPYIEITKEEHPRLIVSRYNKIKDKLILFGPYPNSKAASQTVRILQKIYPLRRCNPVSDSPCIYAHIGLCVAHDKDYKQKYEENIDSIQRFLKGDIKGIIKSLTIQMDDASSNLEFEKALELRDLINSINTTTEKQIITFNSFKNRDFINFASNDDEIAVNILQMREGRVIDNHHVVFSYVDDPASEALSYIREYYERVLIPDELVFDSKFDKESVAFIFNKRGEFPSKGNKKKLIDLCYVNAKKSLDEHFKLHQLKSEKSQEAITELENITNTKINSIEVYDNAHIFGSSAISGMICYEDLKLVPKKYRKFHLKTTTNDDYQAIKEVVYRRLYRKLMENESHCDLILVDGGKGQVNAALEVLSSLELSIPVIGLKKNDKHTLEALIYNNNTITLDRKSNLYALMLKLSEEVHRYAISFHKSTKQKNDYKSILDDIKGLGKARKMVLLSHFKSLEEIKNASVDELIKIGLPIQVVNNLKEKVNIESNNK